MRQALGELASHEPRDTAASLADAAGANVMAVQRMLEHASAAMILDAFPACSTTMWTRRRWDPRNGEWRRQRMVQSAEYLGSDAIWRPRGDS